ncbi:hypothetical protein [Cellulomonas sp.]|uniref:hypothetical protein n=1 Tax=Cellulomonas sp. TaxID=40001 RepID=UPI001B0F2B48|nr:hypothetical protein [Cellulomonas sp.]MBO9554549.1 hypothetical protein [Cellulomonas sp.]
MDRTGPHLARALDDVDAARRALAHAQQVPWVSDAADRYRAALGDALAHVTAVRTAVEHAVPSVAALDVAVGAGVRAGAWSW